MAAGLPVLGSDFPLWRKIIEKAKCGITVDQTNPVEITEKITSLIQDTNKLKDYGLNGRKAVEEEYNWGIEEKLIRGVHLSPVQGLKIVVKQDKRPEILKTDEIRKLLYEAKYQKHDWYFIWVIALLTGMRNGELYSLRWEDVDLDSSILKVERSYNFHIKCFKETKAGYWRTVPISSDLKKTLIELKSTSGSKFVLPRLHLWKTGYQARVLKIFCKSIGLPEIRFHTLRACFATQLIGSGVEPVKVMKICGWKELKTLAIYLRLSGVDEKGATENLKILPNEETINGNIYRIGNNFR
jgi:integrase